MCIKRQYSFINIFWASSFKYSFNDGGLIVFSVEKNIVNIGVTEK